ICRVARGPASPGRGLQLLFRIVCAGRRVARLSGGAGDLQGAALSGLARYLRRQLADMERRAVRRVPRGLADRPGPGRACPVVRPAVASCGTNRRRGPVGLVMSTILDTVERRVWHGLLLTVPVSASPLLDLGSGTLARPLAFIPAVVLLLI